MSADLAAVLLIVAAAPPATLFALLYGLTAPWWRSLVGQGLFVHSAGLALLIDFSLVYRFADADVPDWIRLAVYSIIAAGMWLTFAAFLVEHFIRRRRNRAAARP